MRKKILLRLFCATKKNSLVDNAQLTSRNEIWKDKFVP